jgi:nicotinate phosphoribosyltransferase
MIDFVGRVLRPESSDWVIRSLMDVDFYKFTMAYFIKTYYAGVNVVFNFINRHTHIPVADLVDEGELRRQLDHVLTLRFRRTDIYYLRGMDIYGDSMFPPGYLEFLGGLRLPPYKLERVGNQYKFEVEGPWELATWWETIFLAILSELLYRTLMQSMAEQGPEGRLELELMYAAAKNKLYAKLKRLKADGRVRFADFGQRRRHSFLWQLYAIEMARDVMGPQFVGTSNTWMAFNQDLVPIGTNAHELPMVMTALADTDDGKRDAQYEVLRKWGKLFTQTGVRVMLPDTYGSAQFYEHMPQDLAAEVAGSWRGARYDSGSLIEEGMRHAKFLRRFRIATIHRLGIPSDGLDVDPMINLQDVLGGDLTLSNGWGTKFTNDFDGCHPRGDEQALVHGKPIGLTWNQAFAGHSFVCKIASANGNPAVKLSNNVNKATGPKDEVERYIRIFGSEGRIAQKVIV